MNYSSAKWKARSLSLRTRFPVCYCCDQPSQVAHHRHYKKRLGNESDEDLIALCRPCHSYLEKGVSSGWWSRMDGHRDVKEQIANRDPRAARYFQRKGKQKHIFPPTKGQHPRRALYGNLKSIRNAIKANDLERAIDVAESLAERLRNLRG